MPEPDVLLVSESSGLDDLILKAREFAAASKAASTRRAIGSDWRDFDGWCQEHRLASLPASPETVALYLTDRASTLAPQTLTRRLTAITQAHRAAGYVSGLSPASTKQPVVGAVLHGIRRVKGVAQHGKEALLTEQIRALTATCGDDLQGLRDRALLLVGFAGAFRRSEIVTIDHGNLDFTEDGVVIRIGRSKTDQVGAGRVVGIPFGADPEMCPVRALARWLAAAAITSGPVFRAVDQMGRVAPRPMHPDSVAYIIKRAARRAGLDDEVLAGHSLRSGHVTQAARNGVGERVIMDQTGHKSPATLRRYIRQGRLFLENAAAGLGL